MRLIEEWYFKNIRLLNKLFGNVIYDNDFYEWIRIENFKLPVLYTDYFTKLLITTPGLSGIENEQAWNFYIKKGIKRRDEKQIKHLYELFYNELSNYGYAKLCINIKSFNPSLNFINGDNIADLVEVVYNFLSRK